MHLDGVRCGSYAETDDTSDPFSYGRGWVRGAVPYPRENWPGFVSSVLAPEPVAPDSASVTPNHPLDSS